MKRLLTRRKEGMRVGAVPAGDGTLIHFHI